MFEPSSLKQINALLDIGEYSFDERLTYNEPMQQLLEVPEIAKSWPEQIRFEGSERTLPPKESQLFESFKESLGRHTALGPKQHFEFVVESAVSRRTPLEHIWLSLSHNVFEYLGCALQLDSGS